MKVNIEFDTENSLKAQLNTLNDFFNNDSSYNPSNLDNKKVICHKCGINLFEKYDDETVNKIKNYCKIRYKVKNTDKFNVFCKDCQKTVAGGDSP